MAIRIIHPAELGPTDISSWHSMQNSTPAFSNPFLSPEFAIAVGEIRSNTRIAILIDGPSAVGFFPFERHRTGVGMPIAAGLTDCQGMVHAPGVRWDARELLRACGLSVWHFDHLVYGQHPFAEYRTGSRPSPFIDLTEGFDSYREKIHSRSPQFCKSLERKERKLIRETGRHLRFTLDSRDESSFRALLAWKSQQYRRTSQIDIFSRPWVTDLLVALFNHHSSSFGGLLSVLYADEDPIAAHFGLRGSTILAHWFPAYDTKFHQYSPGLIMHLHMARVSPRTGIRIIDLGTGSQRYKEELKSGDFQVDTGIVTTGSLYAMAYRSGRIGSQRAAESIKQSPALSRVAGWLRNRYRSARNANAQISS